MTSRVKWVALAVAALCPAAASAAAPWSAPARLGTNVVDLPGGSGSIAPLADGDAVVAWQEESTPGAGVFLARMSALGLAQAVLLDPAGRSPQVASDPAEASVVVWIGTDGLYAVLRGSDGELSPVRRILVVPPDREVRRFDVATTGRTIGGGLRAVVVAILEDNALYAQGEPTGSVEAVTLDSGAWSAPLTLATGLRNPVDVDVSGTSAGGAAAAWADGGSGIDGRVFAARMTGTGTWLDIARVGSRTARDVAVAVAETGGSTVAWVQRGPGLDRLLTRTRGPVGRYGDAFQVATGQIGQVALGSDAAGGVTMAWAKRTATQSRLQVTTRVPGSPWGPVGVLAVTPSSIPMVELTVNHRGDALAAWTMFDGASTASHFARYRRGGGTFGPRERTAAAGDGRNAGSPVVSLASTGEAGAVLQLGAGNCCADVAAALRATPPIPTVSGLRLSTNRLVGPATLRVVYRQSRAGTVVVALRPAPRSGAAAVVVASGRAGVNVVSIDSARVPLRAGRFTVSVGPTAHASDPGVLSKTLQRIRRRAR